MNQLRRRLPHVWAEGKHLFVTWHFYGSLPHALYPPPNKQNAGQAFVWMDRYLDSARVGPLYLQAAARSICNTPEYDDLQAFVVMANPVHLLARPRVTPSRFYKPAREANRMARTHEPAIPAKA